MMESRTTPVGATMTSRARTLIDAGRPEERQNTFENDTSPVATEYDVTFDAEEDVAGKGAAHGGLDVSAAAGARDGRTSVKAHRGEMPIEYDGRAVMRLAHVSTGGTAATGEASRGIPED